MIFTDETINLNENEKLSSYLFLSQSGFTMLLDIVR